VYPAAANLTLYSMAQQRRDFRQLQLLTHTLFYENYTANFNAPTGELCHSGLTHPTCAHREETLSRLLHSWATGVVTMDNIATPEC
jgi:hypothetical protein